MDGWVKIHRKITDWEYYGDPNTFRIFFHCLVSANYEDKQWQGINVNRGSFVTTTSDLSKTLSMTPMQVRTSLKKNVQANTISIESTNKYTIIHVLNFESYQTSENGEQQTKTPKLNKQNNKQNKSVNGSILNGCDRKLFVNNKQNNNQITNNVTNKAEESSPYNPYKEEIIKKKEYKETSNFIKLEEKKVKLSFATEQKNMQGRSDNFYQSLVPYVEIYGKEMIRAFYDYWTEPNRSKTKMKFELERTWDTKRRLNTWSNRDKKNINIKSNGTEHKQQQQQERANEILELNRKLSESDSSIR